MLRTHGLIWKQRIVGTGGSRLIQSARPGGVIRYCSYVTPAAVTSTCGGCGCGWTIQRRTYQPFIRISQDGMPSLVPKRRMSSQTTTTPRTASRTASGTAASTAAAASHTVSGQRKRHQPFKQGIDHDKAQTKVALSVDDKIDGVLMSSKKSVTHRLDSNKKSTTRPHSTSNTLMNHHQMKQRGAINANGTQTLEINSVSKSIGITTAVAADSAQIPIKFDLDHPTAGLEYMNHFDQAMTSLMRLVRPLVLEHAHTIRNKHHPKQQKLIRAIDQVLDHLFNFLKSNPHLRLSSLRYYQIFLFTLWTSLYHHFHPFFQLFKTDRPKDFEVQIEKKRQLSLSPITTFDPPPIQSNSVDSYFGTALGSLILDNLICSHGKDERGVLEAQSALEWMQESTWEPFFHLTERGGLNHLLQVMIQLKLKDRGSDGDLTQIRQFFDQLPNKGQRTYCLMQDAYIQTHQIEKARELGHLFFQTKLDYDGYFISLQLKCLFTAFQLTRDPDEASRIVAEGEEWWELAKSQPSALLSSSVTGSMMQFDAIVTPQDIRRQQQRMIDALQLEIDLQPNESASATTNNSPTSVTSIPFPYAKVPQVVYVNCVCIGRFIKSCTDSPSPIEWLPTVELYWSMGLERLRRVRAYYEHSKSTPETRERLLQVEYDAIGYGVLLKYYCITNLHDKLLALWSTMPTRFKDSFVFEVMLLHYAVTGDTPSAESLMMNEYEPHHHFRSFIWSAWLRCYELSGDISGAERIWRKMAGMGVRPNARQYVTMIQVYLSAAAAATQPHQTTLTIPSPSDGTAASQSASASGAVSVATSPRSMSSEFIWRGIDRLALEMVNSGLRLSSDLYRDLFLSTSRVLGSEEAAQQFWQSWEEKNGSKLLSSNPSTTATDKTKTVTTSSMDKRARDIRSSSPVSELE